MVSRWMESIFLLIALAILIVTPSTSNAQTDPFAQNSSEFAFCLSVTGYGNDSFFTEPLSLALDEHASLIYVADSKAGVVDAFSFQGVAKQQYGEKQGLKSPFGLAVSKNGDLYVSEDEAGPIKIINAKGEVTKLDIPKADGEETPKPGKMSFDDDDNLYVVDRANDKICVFGGDRKLKSKIGGRGDKRGLFKTLQDMAVDRSGRVYALDADSVPVQVFDKKGSFIYRFGFHGDDGQDILSPAAIFIDHNDQIWIVDKAQHSLKVFDRSGTYLRTFGSYGQAENSFFYPCDAKIDSLGRVYTVESGAKRLQVFSVIKPFERFAPQGL
jgi:DNA-binding beta-propeller fold protein YncE